MSDPNTIILWDEPAKDLVPSNIVQPNELAEYATQLSTREKRQIITAYGVGSYEMATTFVWGRTMAALKRELGTLGITFLAELLGRSDIEENDSVLEAITDREAIRLAEELGVISRLEAIRLRHSQELVSHFAQRDPTDGDDEMEVTEATNVLHACVKSVLAKPNIQVAREFAEFRKELESESLPADDPRCDTLVGSPYFFQRLAISVLLGGIRVHIGAKLEHCLANLNQLLPRLWPNIREAERWQVGTTYAQVYADGLQAQTAGLKQALLKVRGFDYVPENLRSQSFLKAAEGIIRAHEGLNNFYNEEAPTLHLEKMGTVIPAPALGPCITSLLCVRLGNRFGKSWGAWPIADRLLKQQGMDRWTYYLDKILSSDMRILEKLQADKPRAEWVELLTSTLPTDVLLSNSSMQALIGATFERNDRYILKVVNNLISSYYSNKKRRVT